MSNQRNTERPGYGAQTNLNDEKHPATAVERQAIVDALTGSGSPLTDAELAERLGVEEQGRSVLALALAELERDGRIVRNRAGLRWSYTSNGW